ncbi:MAG: TonB-dependent receptor plug domain-containing protein [Saprospiraceae bacterium]|nr:TonB-dependent receptor plug domain-containing protein [Saprospiraceae bacterium]
MTFVIRTSLVAALFSCWFNHLNAQNNDPDSLLTGKQLTELVVQATRAGDKSPVPHTNFSAKQIRGQYHAQDIPFLLSSVPSLVETSDAGAGTGYTGLRIRGSDPTRVNITLNGIPVNDAESQGVFWVNMPDLAGSVSEIQVQRGVGTSTNGAGAFGATINLDLSQVERNRYARVQNTLGSFGTRKHSLQLGTGLMDNGIAFSARVSNIHSDGFVDRATSDLNGIHLTGAYLDENQSLQIHLLSGHERTYQAWNGLPAQYLELSSLRTYNASGTERMGAPHPDEVDDYTQRHFLLHYKYRLPGQWQLQLNGHYTRGFGFFEQYKADQQLSDYGLMGDSAQMSSDLIRRRWLDNHFLGGTFALRSTEVFNNKTSVLIGGGWNQYLGDHFGELVWSEQFTGVQNDYRYYDNRADKRDANLFVKLETAPSEPLNLFLDLQVRGVQYKFLGFDNELRNVSQTSNLLFFNPKVGANYSFSPLWQSYFFLGVAHREPNRDDFTQSTPASRPKPEQLLNLETGVRQRKETTHFSANIFGMYYRNQLALDGRINDVGAYIRTNVPVSCRAGLELEAGGKWGKRLTWAGSASFSQNKIKEFREYVDNWDDGSQAERIHRNTDLAFSPSVVARAEAGWIWWEKHNGTGKGGLFSSSMVAKYVSRQFLDNTSNLSTSLPQYLVCDLRLNLALDRWIGKQINLIFSVNNFFDERFESNGWAYRFTSVGYDPRPDDPYARLEQDNTYHLAGFFPQAGRHWMATIQWSF